MTDHKALEEIRRKPYFENNRINRWIEKIQEYDFSVEYVKGELMTDADALSRQYEQARKAEREQQKEARAEKTRAGKWNKHVETRDGKEFWRFDSGKTTEIPRVEERKSLVVETHERLEHRGAEAVYYAMRNRWYWPGMKETIKNEVRKCETCQENNRKRKGGSEFVTTSRKLEKVGLDVMRLSEEDKYALVMIDYFTRAMWVEVLSTKRTKGILEVLDREIQRSGQKPEEIITDNEKEFCGGDFTRWCLDRGIRHRRVGVESHGSNGRVERAIGTIREGLAKRKEGALKERISKIVDAYNNTLHTGIGCTPKEAWEEERDEVQLENSKLGKYAGRMKKGFREEFEPGQLVRIANREKLGSEGKKTRGRFLRTGEVVMSCGGDSYLVKGEAGRLMKKRHYDLKGVAE